LLALMVVWGYPCESKSSPAHYSKHPHSNEWGCFFIAIKNIFVGNKYKIVSYELKFLNLIEKTIHLKSNQLNKIKRELDPLN
ncbi:hypothetical protein KTI61_18635, partial [Acinetobacter pittii]|uniref:hypothetical protein n=1 Tax=Acinetobacter pittii TaxID=48296 RepID=UPI0021CD5F4E